MTNSNDTQPRWKVRTEIEELQARLKAERMENIALCERHHRELGESIRQHNDKVRIADRAIEMASTLAGCMTFLVTEGILLLGLASQDAMDPFLVVSSLLLAATLGLGAYAHVRDALWDESE